MFSSLPIPASLAVLPSVKPVINTTTSLLMVVESEKMDGRQILRQRPKAEFPDLAFNISEIRELGVSRAPISRIVS